jgi:predicted MFS family arabinose efflux permease
LDTAFVALAAGCLVGAVVVALLVREGPLQPQRDPAGASPLRDGRIRRMGLVSALLVVPQFAVVALVVVYLVDEQGVGVAAAALLLAGIQFGGGAARVVAGRWSDRLGQRLVPLRRLARVIAGLFVAVAVLAAFDGPVVVPVLLVAGVVAISWNGLAFVAVGEMAGPGRAGTALGVQNTAVALGAAVTAPVLAAVVERTSWSVGFAVAAAAALTAVLLLRPLVGDERLRRLAA